MILGLVNLTSLYSYKPIGNCKVSLRLILSAVLRSLDAVYVG